MFGHSAVSLELACSYEGRQIIANAFQQSKGNGCLATVTVGCPVRLFPSAEPLDQVQSEASTNSRITRCTVMQVPHARRFAELMMGDPDCVG